MICSHLRNFPKPGASWILTQHTLSRALELNLHRSAKSCTFEEPLTTLDIEMRKRIFWSLLTIHVTLSGKLGRPMSLRMEDYDIEIPDPISDEQLIHDGTNGLSQEKCLHKVGIHAFQIVPLYMELYSTIYAVRRRPEKYVLTVNALEAKLQAWEDALSPELVNGQEQEDRVFTLYSQVWADEFRLLLRHPSMSMTNDETFNAESLKTCAKSARKMLAAVRKIQEFNCLDTTWYNTAVYVMALTTTLFVEYERRDTISRPEVESLKVDMGAWLEILGNVGQLLGISNLFLWRYVTNVDLGSGFRLREAVREVIMGPLTKLDLSLAGREASRNRPLTEFNSLPARSESTSRVSLANRSANSINTKTSDYIHQSTPQFDTTSAASTGYAPLTVSLQQHQNLYPQSTQYQPYTEASGALPQSPYPPQNNHNFISNTKVEDASDLVRFARQANQAAAQTPLMDPGAFQRRQNIVHYTGPQAWNVYTTETVDTFGMSEPFSVNSIAPLGPNDMNTSGMGIIHQNMHTPASAPMDQGQFTGDMPSISSWPQAAFNMLPNQN
jgi:hypothetical protein